MRLPRLQEWADGRSHRSGQRRRRPDCNPGRTSRRFWLGPRGLPSRRSSVLASGVGTYRFRRSARQPATSGSTRAMVQKVPPPAIGGTFVRPSGYRRPRVDEGAVVRVDLDELVEHWTLLDDERELIAGKRGPTRLGFAVLLKFYARAGRFPAAGPSWTTRRSRSSPARSASRHPTSGSTNGLAARSSTTGRRSATTSGSGSAPPMTPSNSPDGSRTASARPSVALTGCASSCLPGAGRSGSSRRRRAAATGSSARPCTRPSRR